MSAYAVAHMHEVAMGPDIVEYLQRIDATLAPFGGGRGRPPRDRHPQDLTSGGSQRSTATTLPRISARSPGIGV
jgi:hypothetical protein